MTQKAVRLLTVGDVDAALRRAYRWSRRHGAPCYVLRRRDRVPVQYLAHPWPIPPRWMVLAVVASPLSSIR